MEDTIKQIEKGLGYPLSDEQRTILKSNFQCPTLVNACAGAGKTTTMITSIFYQAMIGRNASKNVLGITFSNKAEKDMEEKFGQIQQQIATANPQVSTYKMPKFRTFHALFYHLLQRIYPHYHFHIVSWTKYTNILYKDIKYPKKALNDYENVKRIMNHAEMLINMGYSYDGYTIRQNEPNVKTIVANLINPIDKNDNYHQLVCLLHYYGMLEQKEINDYITVINHYNQIKQDHAEIDFNDMQYMLENALNNVKESQNNRLIVQSQVYNIKQLYIDEFQDINPIQWELIMQIFKPEVINHIVVIGDDDQSIYRFRGSNPNFILTFADKFKKTKAYLNAQTFNLSTNYRTKENILNLVKPMIESNQLRLAKSLKAHQTGGTIKRYFRDENKNDQAVEELIQDIKAYPQRKIALLARENIDLGILADYLADHEIYPKFGESNQQYIFQNTNTYKTFTTLMHALYYDDFTEYQKYANHIGFRNYQQLLKNYSNQKISDFLENSTWRQDLQAQIQNPKSSWKARRDYQRIYELKENFQLIQENKNEVNTQKYLTVTLFNIVNNMTQPYYDYMTQKHYLGISNNQLDDIKDHLEELSRQAESCGAFFLKENQKKNAMISSNSPIEGMTFHRSKGLEFDETLIYSLNHDPVDENAEYLSEVFPANQKPNDLVETIIKHPALSLGLIYANGLTSAILFNQRIYSQNKEMENSFVNLMTTIAHSKFNYLPKIKFDTEKFKNDRHLINLMYLEVNNLVRRVEEEKRLLYVAVTRAKDKVIFDQTRRQGVITEQLNFESEE